MERARSRCAVLALGTALFWVGPASAANLETAPPPATVEYGAHLKPDGWVDFGLRAPSADMVDLLIYDTADAKTPATSVPMTRNGTGDWGIRVHGPGVGAGTFYMYRLTGHGTAAANAPFGTVMNGNFVLNDPYAYRTGEVGYSKFYLSPPFVDTQQPIYAGGGKSVVYDHGADPAPSHVMVRPEDLIVYELHVQDYTARLDGLPPALRGTYLGLTQGGLKTPGGLTAGIDHLAELGVTAVELMPVMQYDKETTSAPGRVNHWGYMTTNFVAPESRYASQPGEEVVELKHLVQAFHDRGIAVFMDVVYNHTAEGSWVQDGRLADKCYNLCDDIPEIYRGTGNGFFANASGTGNDVDFSGGGRFTKRLVRDSLTLWHTAYGVDGFRFDLARVLADGSTDAAAWVSADPRFARAHLHAEPWDLEGQWWNFMDSPPWDWQNNRWAKWIGKYRDGTRLFSKSDLRDPGTLKRLIEGRGAVPGADGPASSKPWRSINFVAIHDGYTLRDCMFFNDSDGSQNCWDSSADEDLRRRREKFLLGLLLTSNGVPLLQQGDEFGRTKSGAGQDGAKNSWDWESTSGDAGVNGVNWIDWALKDGNPDGSPNGPRYGRELSEWTRGLIALRRRWTQFRQADFAEYAAAPRAAPGDPANDGRLSYSWQGPAAGSPSQLAVIRWGRPGEPDLMVIYNESWSPFSVTNLADWSRRPWRVLARSWVPHGDDLCALPDWTACPDAGTTFTVDGRAMAILAASRD
jgi:glycogen operon protein